MYGHAYSLSPSGIFVARRLARTSDPRIWRASRSASATTPAATTPPSRDWSAFLERDQINCASSGTPHDRARLAADGQLPAANVFGAQFYITEQLGFRKIVDTTFMMGFLLSSEADLEDTDRYFRALRRAQREIDLEPEPYKHYYARELPADLASPGGCAAVRPRRAHRLRAVHPRDLRTHAALDADVGPVHSGGRGAITVRRRGARVTALRQLKIAPTGMRLHEWIALERGYFQAAGIEPIVRWDIVSGIMSSWQGKAYMERPQDLPFVGTSEPVDVINHCAWGSVCNAGAGLGKFVPDAYGVARWAIYVRPDSSIRRRRIWLTCRSPSACALAATSTCRTDSSRTCRWSSIKTVNIGGFGARLTALLDG